MVRTRSNLDTADIGPLPFDPSDIARIDKPKKRTPLAFNYYTDLLLKTLDDRLISFFLTKTGFEDDAESEWVPVRGLGLGRFVRVGLWKKMHAIGSDLDRVVIKEDRLNPWIEGAAYDVGLAREAVMQGHLTAMKDGRRNITQLRAYKFLPNHTYGGPEQDRCRLYQRFAPHGTLEDVWWRYRSFRTYLPELYLWSVLVDLAKAIVLLRKCPATWNPISRLGRIPRDMEQDPDAFLLHQDMKHINCFVGGADTKTSGRLPYYPTELGDFGLAQVRKPDSGAKHFFCYGTESYYAPEQCSYGENWQHKIYDFRIGALGITETTNAWGIGLILWHLMTLKSHLDFPSKWRQPCDATQAAMPPPDPILEGEFHNIYNRHFMPYSTMDCEHPAGQYSKELKDIVYQCLRPDFTERPTATDLLRRAQQGYKTCLKMSRKEGPRAVHFSNSAMNDHVRPPGDATFVFSQQNTMDQWIFHRMILHGREQWGDPEDTPLKPRAGWHDFQIGAPAPPERGEYENKYPQNHPQYALVGQELADDLRQGKLIGRKNVPSFLVDDPKMPKRARSWDSQDEDELEMRYLLRGLRVKTQGYASGKSIRLLTYILECEKYDVVAAEQVLKWLYRAGATRIRFPWAQKPAVQQQAGAAKRKWIDLFGASRPRTLRECMYFIVNEPPGVVRVEMAIKRMDYIFRPEDVAEEPFSSIPASPIATDDYQRAREVIVQLFDAYERGVAPYPHIDECRLVICLRENNGDVQAAAAQMTQDLQHHPQSNLDEAIATQRRQAQRENHGPRPSQRSRRSNSTDKENATPPYDDGHGINPGNGSDDDNPGGSAWAAGRPPGGHLPGIYPQQNEVHDPDGGADPRGRHQPPGGHGRGGHGVPGLLPLGEVSELTTNRMMGMADVPHGGQQPAAPRWPYWIPPARQYIPPPAGAYPYGQPNHGNGAAALRSEDDFIPQLFEVDGVQQAIFPQQQLANGQGDRHDLDDTDTAQDGEDQNPSDVDAKEEVNSNTDGEQSEISEFNFDSEDEDDADTDMPPTSRASRHAAAWRVQKEQERPHVTWNLGDVVQGMNRDFINTRLHNMPEAQRKNSLPGFHVGDRQDADFGEVDDDELERGDEELLYMSGGLGEGDTLDMEKDPEFQRQLKEADRTEIEDGETLMRRLQKEKEEERRRKEKERKGK